MPLSFTGPESFYTADEEAWWASVDKALKGVPREKLFGKSDDGLEIAPLYPRRSDVPARVLRPADGDWSVVQRIDIPDPTKANAQILEDLVGGASGLELVFSSALTSYGHGIWIEDMEGMAALLNGVQPDLIDIRLEAGRENVEVLALLLAYLDKQGIEPATVRVFSSIDPYAWVAMHGFSVPDMDVANRYFRDIVEAVAGLGSPARVVKADGRVWHSVGATPAQELGLVLACAAAHLRSLERTNLAPEDWAGRISVNLTADADQFGTIAKARAFRALWSCVLDGAGLPQSPMHLHMSTSHRMLTRNDPWVNLLRNTVAAFAAGVGGADSVCVLPHTLAAGLPDAFARRLARNTQSILLEESNLAKVMDPAAGSGAIEDRTESLCTAAWAFFQEIEAAGGVFEALHKGFVQERVLSARSNLEKNVAGRKRPITGVSEFPDLFEKPVDVLHSEGHDLTSRRPPLEGLPEPDGGTWFKALCKSALEGQPLPDLSMRLEQRPDLKSLKSLEAFRASEPFERLRAAADAFTIDTGAAPAVFLASLGPLAKFTARATWSANAFAAGGLNAVAAEVYGSIEDLTTAFKASGATIACLVSSDDIYEAEAEIAARALKTAGASHLYLAGKPGANETRYREAGIDTYLFAGCDLLSLLQEAHARLGVAPSDLEVPA